MLTEQDMGYKAFLKDAGYNKNLAAVMNGKIRNQIAIKNSLIFYYFQY
jgi:hypothetical protein